MDGMSATPVAPQELSGAGVQELGQVQPQSQPQEQEQANGVYERGTEGAPVGLVSESELHRACAEGNLEQVRAVLSASLEALETLGCTPIVLAIRANYHDVVRELLSAGAIVPPPGLTNDQGMLSLLYPQHMYGLPPFMQAPPEFYQPNAGMYMPPPSHQHQLQHQHQHMHPQHQQGPGPQGPGFYAHAPPPQHGQGHGHGHGGNGPYGRRDRGNSMHRPDGAVHGHPNLPPAEVAKTIPCRNFPQCKYGASCMFFHPDRPAFFPQQNGGPYGFDGQPQGQQGFQQQGYPPQDAAPSGVTAANGEAPASAPEAIQTEADSSAAPASAPMQPLAPNFQPGQPMPIPENDGAAPFGSSPLSPSDPAGSLVSLPPSDAFYAQSPPGAGIYSTGPGGIPPFVPMGAGAPGRRQSFGQFGGVPAGPGSIGARPYGKKPSFSGGPRPFAPRGPGGPAGAWKDGVPPPCMFFGLGKCRNGEMCKFPHLDAEGNDCRNPDVIKGIVAPMPPITASRPRAPRASFGPVAGSGPGGPGAPFDPVQRQQQLAFLQQQRAAVQNANANANANINLNAAQAAPLASVPASSTPSAVPSQSPTPVTDSDASVTQAASQTLVGSEVDIKAAEVSTDVSAPISTESAVAVDAKAVDTEVGSVPSNEAVSAESAPAPAANNGNGNGNNNSTANLPAKPIGVLPPVAVGRSASQPGLQRVQANGFHARQNQHQHQHQAHGPFHPHARRGGANGPHGRGFAPGMNGRSASADGKVRPTGAAAPAGQTANQQSSPNGGQANGAKAASQQQQQQQQQRQQRVPRADEFPALGGMGASMSASATTSPSAPGRTAAQVLSEPAPIKAIPPPVAAVPVPAAKDAKVDSDNESVTMTSDDESDAVIISCKPSSTSATAPPTAPASVHASGVSSPVKRAPVSFARIAGALAGATSTHTSTQTGGASTPAVPSAESAPRAVKA